MILTSHLLSQLDWIEHGFGTRVSLHTQDEMASLKQIHSALTLVVDHAGLAGEGDALVTHRPGLDVSVRTADCYPILLADSRRKRVAAVHAGWRGTATGIVKSAIARMESDPADITAAIGPGIGVCCYEVGADVARRFGYSGAGKIDLAEANRKQLMDAGVPADRIEIAGECTFCEEDNGVHKYHSFRRDKEEAGRMISYIRVRP